MKQSVTNSTVSRIAFVGNYSPPPIETPQGWLVIYHGVKQSCAGCIYRLGLALFDLNKPQLLLKRSNDWVFAPEEPYEQRGDVGYVVFPCGYTIGHDGDAINLYYGAADTALPWRPAVYATCLSGLNSTANRRMIMHRFALDEIMKHMTRLKTLRKKKLQRLFSRMSKRDI